MSDVKAPSLALTATYVSPTAERTFSHPLPTSANELASSDAKTAYLAALRSNVTKLQEDVNSFLTQKMDEDNAAAGGRAQKIAGKDESKEEENYGEEVIDDTT
ncbi:MAG: hypothetical protein M1838_000744 [Thelocarpon superellum]|nr:MAG: hypothetical protein M1838_000744 [Thelocarpon superellum]